MISYADDDTAATVSDWFDCADAFLLGRMTARLATATKRDRASFAEPATPAQHGCVAASRGLRPGRTGVA